MDKQNQGGKDPFKDFNKDEYITFEQQKKKINDRRLNDKRHKDKHDKFDDWN